MNAEAAIISCTHVNCATHSPELQNMSSRHPIRIVSKSYLRIPQLSTVLLLMQCYFHFQFGRHLLLSPLYLFRCRWVSLVRFSKRYECWSGEIGLCLISQVSSKSYPSVSFFMCSFFSSILITWIWFSSVLVSASFCSVLTVQLWLDFWYTQDGRWQILTQGTSSPVCELTRGLRHRQQPSECFMVSSDLTQASFSI